MSPRETVPSVAWQFARVEGGKGLDNQGAEQAIVPSDSHIHMPGGFATGWIYELLYEARDPRVLGLGHVAVRDVLSFLKYGETDAAGTANPLRAGSVAHREGLRLGPLAKRARDPRLHPSGLQRRRAGTPRARWRAAACRRRRTAVDEPPLRQRRHFGRPAVRGPRQSRRPLSVLLCQVHAII